MDKEYILKTDEFEREDQINQFVYCLQNKKLPLKFAYIGKTAHTHDKLVRSKEYKLSDNEGKLIREKLTPEKISKNIPRGFNIIDIGSGNGLKATSVIYALKKQNLEINYLALDYSDELLLIASKNIIKCFPHLGIQTIQTDFEERSFVPELSKIHLVSNFENIFLFLGTTLGNPFNRERVLQNICDSMKVGDTLLVGVELYDEKKISEVLSHYNNVPFYNAVFNPLTFAGVNFEDGELKVLFNQYSRNVEVHFIFNKRISILCRNHEHIDFFPNDDLFIFVSHRFTKEELISDLNKVGISSLTTLLDKNSNYALFICKKNDSN